MFIPFLLIFMGAFVYCFLGISLPGVYIGVMHAAYHDLGSVPSSSVMTLCFMGSLLRIKN